MGIGLNVCDGRRVGEVHEVPLAGAGKSGAGIAVHMQVPSGGYLCFGLGNQVSKAFDGAHDVGTTAMSWCGLAYICP